MLVPLLKGIGYLNVEMIQRVIKMDVKTNLKDILNDRGLKQSFIAAKIGVRQGTMSNLVNGKTIPTLTVALKIAEVLEMKVEEIWTLY